MPTFGAKDVEHWSIGSIHYLSFVNGGGFDSLDVALVSGQAGRTATPRIYQIDFEAKMLFLTDTIPLLLNTASGGTRGTVDPHMNKQTDQDIEHWIIGKNHYLSLGERPCCGWGRMRIFSLGGPTYQETTPNAVSRHVTLVYSHLILDGVTFSASGAEQLLHASISSHLHLRSTTLSSPTSLTVSGSGNSYSLVDSTFQTTTSTGLVSCSSNDDAPQVCPGNEVLCVDGTTTSTTQCYGCGISKLGAPYVCGPSILTRIVNGPARFMKTNVATLTVLTNDLKCSTRAAFRLDGNITWTNTTTTDLMFRDLPLGDHTVEVRGLCSLEDIDVESASFKWTVFDQIPPSTIINGQRLFNSREPSFDLSGSKPGCGIEFTVDSGGAQYIQGASADVSLGVAVRVAGPTNTWPHNEVLVTMEASTGAGTRFVTETLPLTGGVTIIEAQHIVNAVSNQGYLHLSLGDAISGQFGLRASVGDIYQEQQWETSTNGQQAVAFPSTTIRTHLYSPTTRRTALFMLGSSAGPDKTSFLSPTGNNINGGVWLDGVRVKSNNIPQRAPFVILLEDLTLGPHTLKAKLNAS